MGRLDAYDRSRQPEWKQVQGEAEPPEVHVDKLWVRFDNGVSRLLSGLTKGEYWVRSLNDDYRVALVGHPNRKYLWLLSREPGLTVEQRDELLTVTGQ